MIDREKVVKGLECCLSVTKCGTCPYNTGDDSWCGNINQLLEDSIALLKVQKTQVMTINEVETWVMIDRVNRAPIVVEVRDRFITWIVGDEYYDLPECDLSIEFYGKTWRCWTSRPTDEQREAEPWK